MTDAGLIFVIDSLLAAKTKTAAKGFLEQCSDAYRPIAERILARFTFARTTNQNALIHQWFGQIADHYGDRTAKDVKGLCHHTWALDIRLRDDQFAWVWERTGALLDYQRQCSLLASETLGISSRMTTKELKEYADAIERHYHPLGVPLINPEDKK